MTRLINILKRSIKFLLNSNKTKYHNRLSHNSRWKLFCLDMSFLLSKRVIIFSIIILFNTNKLLADYTINTGANTDPATTPALRDATGTISIYGTMAIYSDVTFTSSTPLRILIYGTSGQIYWYANKTLTLPAGSTIAYVNNPTAPPGLQPTSGNASQILEIGSVKYACTNDNSNNVVFSFVQLNSIGGTPTLSATTSTPSVCYGSTASLSATQVLPSGVSYYFQWSISPSPGNFSNNNTSAATSTSLSNAPAGTDSVICGLYANTGGTNYYLVTSDTVILTVKPTPVAPTYSVTQPTCTVASGNISVSAPTGAGLTYSTDGATYTNTTGAFSGMPAGAYNLTAKNSNGCISPITAVTVNAPPAAPGAPTASVTQPTCTVTTGTITITAPAGTGITYSSDGITYSNTSGVFSNLSPGTYSLTAKNSSSCISPPTSVTVNAQPPRPTGTLSGSASICNGSSASLNIAVTGAGSISGTLSDGTAFSGTAPSITISVSPSSTKTYTISSLTNGTCSSIASDKTGDATITVTTQPSATISYGGTPFCSNTGTGTVTFSGSLGGTFSSTASINSNTGAINLAATTPGTYTITYTVPASGGCGVYTTTTSIMINPNTWTGGASTNWNTPGNWVANGIVNACPDFTVLSGVPYQPILNSGTATVQNLIINPGATLTITNATLQISGTINNSGTFDASNGTIEMNGTSAQTIPAGAFLNNALSNLIISNTNSGGVSLGGALDIYNSLTYSGSGKKLTTNDNLTFKSTATATAWLGDMTGNTLTGKATVERYVLARKAWRFLSIPANTTQTVRQTWQEGASSPVSNPVPGFGTQVTSNRSSYAADGFDSYSAGGPSVKRYDPANNSWIGITSTANAIKATDGYMVFIRGDRMASSISATPTQTVLRTKGNLYTGDQAPIAVGAGKFTSIGNPYPSALDMRNITKTGVKDFFYLWDPALAGYYGYGAYQTFSNNGSGNYVITPGGGSYGSVGSISNYIASGQAFFVQGDTGGGSVTLKEGAKTTGSGVVSIAQGIQNQSKQFAAQAMGGVVSTPQGMPLPQLRVTLYGVNADNSTYVADGLLINYDDSYSNTVDDMDAIKSVNTSENLSVKTAGKLLVVERRQPITDKDTIFLNLTGVKVQKYRFEFTADQVYQPGLRAFLQDNYLHTGPALNIDGTTTIDFSVVNIAGSYAANRFMIVFSQLGALPVTFTSVKAYQKDKNIDVEWNVENELNIQQYEVEKSTDGSLFTNLSVTTPAGNGGQSASYQVTDTRPVAGYNYYRIKSVDDNGKTAYSNVVKVMTGDIQQEITVYPNPVKNGVINLHFNNQPAGNYIIRLLDKSGQVLASKEINHDEGSSTETVSLNKYIPHGIYQLEIATPDYNIKTIKLSF
jgi:hypothetical protein